MKSSVMAGGVRSSHSGGAPRRSLLPTSLLVAVAGALVLLLGAAPAQALSLPDNRGYEMVTPPQKDSGEPFVRFAQVDAEQAAGDGNRMAYFSVNAFPDSQFDGSFYLATRSTTNWSSQNLIPPQSTEGSLLCPVIGVAMVDYSPDLTKGVLSDGAGQSFGCGTDSPQLTPGEPQGVANLFVRDNLSGTYQLVTPMAVTGSNADAFFVAASPGLGHVLFAEQAQLTADAPAGQNLLYDWSGGTVRLATYVNGTPVAGWLAGNSPGFGPSFGNAFHAVSADGTRILFQYDDGTSTNLYDRLGGTTTVQVDASQAGGSGGGGTFQFARSDGSKVFFSAPDTSRLTSDTVTGSNLNLYEYDVDSGALTDLTPFAQVDFQGFTAAADDGSYLYFVANGALGTAGATAGQPNLFVLHDGAITFIATLDGSNDTCDWNSGCFGFPLSYPTARASSNGRFLGFTSAASLNGADTGGLPQIYLYDAGTGALACVSCEAKGVGAPQPSFIRGAQVPVSSQVQADYLERYVSDGGQLFFDTQAALLPADTNGWHDVYEYGGGQLSLLTTGTGEMDSLFMDASRNGSDVFFSTPEQLLPADTDGAQDIYDARVGGGFPVSTPPPQCTGDGCRPPASGAPASPMVASVTFSGPGNAKPGTAVSPRVSVLHRTVRGTTFRLRIKVAGRGRITVTGRGLRRASRSVSRAGTYTVTVHLTAAEQRLLRRRHKLRLTITVRFAPSGGTASIRVTAKA